MKRIKPNLAEQGVLFSNHYVGDRLSKDDEVYSFKKLINKIDLTSVMNKYSSEGGRMYSPKDQLAVILYAFLKGITSSVKIAELVRNSLPFIYLAGGHLISRRAISDFRLKHLDSIEKIFKDSIKLASKINLINSAELFALDGSKIEANASSSKTRRKVDWEEREKEIEIHVKKFLEEWEKNDQLEKNYEEEQRIKFNLIQKKMKELDLEEEQKKSIRKDNDDDIPPPSGSGDREVQDKEPEFKKENKIKINDLNDADKYLSEINKIRSLLKKNQSIKYNKLLNLSDPDCRMMKKGKRIKESYNVQILTNNQVILSTDVVQDENDQMQLEPLVEQLKSNINLGNNKIKLACDAGYNRGKNLKYLFLDKKIDPYVSMRNRSETMNPSENKYHKENFKFNKKSNSFICSNGKSLKFMKSYTSEGKSFDRYGCSLEDCIYCSERENCVIGKSSQSKGYRTLDDDGCLIYRKRMRKKMKKKVSKDIYSKRAPLVEGLFGQIKNNRSFRRFRLRGLKKVNGEFLYMAVAHNLGKIMRLFNNNSLKESFT